MRFSFLNLFLGCCFLVGSVQAEVPEDNWPTWRGPTPNGVAIKGNPPTTWSETENIKWKVPVPGNGHSTPIIWGNKLFLQTAIQTKQGPELVEELKTSSGTRKMSVHKKVPYDFRIICIDRSNGKTLWEKTVKTTIPHEGHHPTSSFASFSPVTDGRLLWVSFGSQGLYCFDLDGNEQWRNDLIEMETRMHFGESSSPTIAGDAVVVLLDHQGDSKIMAFNKITGKPMWEKERDEETTWSSPVGYVEDGKNLVLTNATNFVRSYDAQTGHIVWQSSGQTVNTIPSPVFGFGNVYCSSGFRGAAFQAIKLGGKGDLTGSSSIAWEYNQDTPYVPSPLLYEDKIYFLSNTNAVLTCVDAKTGEALYAKERLRGLKKIYASPVGAAGKVYLADRAGTVFVLKHGDELEILAQNSLDPNEAFDSSPVVVGDELYLRGTQHLYCIAN